MTESKNSKWSYQIHLSYYSVDWIRSLIKLSRSFRIESARESIKVDVVASFEAVEKLTLLLESELEEMMSTSWSTVGPMVKSMKGTPKGGKGGKDGKNNDSKGKKGKDGKGKEKGKGEPCYFFTET